MHLKVEALLLTCVLGTFRKESIYSFALDPSHYLSTPGDSWHVIPSVTNVNLKLIHTNLLKAQFWYLLDL